MGTVKTRLQADLAQSMKARDEVATATIRMALAAIHTEEVAGKTARELTDEEELGVLRREVKKRREAADAYTHAGRAASAEREQAEGRVLERYLPAQLSDAELSELVQQAVRESGATEPRQLGLVMRLAQAKIAGRADGARVAAEVRRQLSQA